MNRLGKTLAGVAMALGQRDSAEAVLRSRAGERRMPLEDFFQGYRRTALGRCEVLACSRPSIKCHISRTRRSSR